MVLLGLIAGFGIAAGATPLRAVARAAGGWIAGFPYLALAVLVGGVGIANIICRISVISSVFSSIGRPVPNVTTWPAWIS